MLPLRTPRLSLRSLQPEDAEDLAERRSDPATAEYQAWSVPYPLAKARDLIAEIAAHEPFAHGEWTQLAIVRTSDDQILGDVATRVSADGHTAEVGYTLHTWARGSGVATEAAAALCEHLVRVVGVHRLEASTHPDNTASNAVLARLGFAREGTQRENYWVEDQVTDTALFGLLARDWVWPRPR
ncbi:GNAT family N-acetyltransferase [Nocardioides sp.]|uniref:GNAT family N-acetyltransferase n=1 Tax=Nocardioides sp. TaxID=35761 RepID=UPI003D0D3198